MPKKLTDAEQAAHDQEFARYAARLAALQSRAGRGALARLHEEQGRDPRTSSAVTYTAEQWAAMDAAPPALAELRPEDLLICHRQWVWTDHVRSWSIGMLKRAEGTLTEDPHLELLREYSAGLVMRYSLLFSVVEATERGRPRWPQPFKSDLNRLKGTLNHSRNATFHAPRTYWDDRWTDLFNEKTPLPLLRIHRAIGQFLLTEIERRDWSEAAVLASTAASTHGSS